jgi:hypothetical protein
MSQNLNNDDNQKKVFNISKITIDTDDKLVAYNNFHEAARQLTSESIRINAAIKQVNFTLGCIHKRKLVLDAKKKVLDEYALLAYNEEGPKIFISNINYEPTIADLDLNYKYNSALNIIHLEADDPSLASNPSTPASLNFDDDDDKLLSSVDLSQTSRIKTSQESNSKRFKPS